MIHRLLACAAATLVLAAPAAASVTILGNGLARQCYLAADSARMPQPDDIANCDRALVNERLTIRDTVATYVNRGILHVRRGSIQGGIADFDAAIALDPREPEAYLNKGAALLRQDDPARALPLFTVALDRGTRKPAIAHFGRAVAHEALGELRSAYHDYQRASQLDPNWPLPAGELARFTVRD